MIAEKYHEAGQFTAFIAYEWTSNFDTRISDEVPGSIQRRAYTSPIWYNP